MRPSFYIRSGKPEDANRLAVLATQVWLHTYANNGITAEIAEYVLGELTTDKYRVLMNDHTCQVFAAASNESLIGFAVVKLGNPCPTGNASSVELQTLYVQEHFLGCGVGKSLL
jgi:diamine N-acetyltransferase